MLLKDDTVWSMDHLNRYINDKFRKTKGLPRDWVFTAFTVRGLGGGARVLGVCGGVVCTGLGVEGPGEGGRVWTGQCVSVWMTGWWELAFRSCLHLSLS